MPNCQTCGKEGIWFSSEWNCKKCHSEKHNIVEKTREYSPIE